jgi:amidase
MRRAVILPAILLWLAACDRSTVAPEYEQRAAMPAGTSCLQVLNGIDLQAVTVPELLQAVAQRRLSSADLVGRYLERIAAFDTGGPKLNSIRALAPNALDQARSARAGPLRGIPVLLKDNIGTTDMPTTAGSIALAVNIPKSEATITRKLREAGAIVLGKTNLSEFANWVDLRMPNGYSSLGGQVIAAYDFKADPLGSSTGSGVAGTMAFAALAIGTETSGSIISPAYVHSLVGVKPTLGLVSRFGIIPLAPSFDTAGPMTRNVTDAAVLLGVIAGADVANDPATQRFVDSALQGVVPDYVAALSATALEGKRLGVRSGDVGASALFDAALAVLREQGATIVEFPDPVSQTIASSSDGSFLEIVAIPNEFKLSLNRYLAEQSGDAVPVETLSDIIAYNDRHPDKVKYGQTLLIASDAQTGSELDPAYVVARDGGIAYASAWIDTVMDANGLDAIVAPDWSNISSTAASGYPNVIVPMGYAGQAPHGVSFAGRAFAEATLLALAYDYEQATRLRVPATVLNPALAPYCPP